MRLISGGFILTASLMLVTPVSASPSFDPRPAGVTASAKQSYVQLAGKGGKHQGGCKYKFKSDRKGYKEEYKCK